MVWGFLRAFETPRRFLEKIWKLKHGHGAVALGSWIARSGGKLDNMPDMFQKLKWLKRSVVRQDRPVNCNLPLLQPEFVSKIDFAEGEERRNCYGIKMAEDWGDFWVILGGTVVKRKIQPGVEVSRSLIAWWWFKVVFQSFSKKTRY